jgi:hypothetical protein
MILFSLVRGKSSVCNNELEAWPREPEFIGSKSTLPSSVRPPFVSISSRPQQVLLGVSGKERHVPSHAIPSASDISI